MAHIEFILAAVTVVLTLAWFLSQSMFSKRTSRDLVWRTALVVVALTPGMSLIRGEILPWQWPIAILPAAKVVLPISDGEAVSSKTMVLEPAPAEPTIGETPFASPIRPAPDRPSEIARTERTAERSPNAETADASNAISAEPPKQNSGQTWLGILALIWLMGFLFQGARICRAAWNAHRLIGSAQPVADPSLMELNGWSAHRVGLKDPAALLTSAGVDVPVVSGA